MAKIKRAKTTDSKSVRSALDRLGGSSRPSLLGRLLRYAVAAIAVVFCIEVGGFFHFFDQTESNGMCDVCSSGLAFSAFFLPLRQYLHVITSKFDYDMK